MNKLLSCRYNMDTNRVEAQFEGGTPLSIDCMQHFQCNALFLRTGKRTARGTYPQWIFQAQPYSAQGSAYYAELRSHSIRHDDPRGASAAGYSLSVCRTNRNVPVYLRSIRKKSSNNFHSPKWHSRVSVPIRKPLQRFTALWQRPTQTK